MTKESPMPNDQAALTTAPAAVWSSFGHWGLVIHWSLVLPPSRLVFPGFLRLNSPDYGLAHATDGASRRVPRHRMAFLEGRRLAGEHSVYFTFFRAVVGDRKTQKGRGAGCVLVVEPGRLRVPPGLRSFSTGFGFHLRLPLHLDSLQS